MVEKNGSHKFSWRWDVDVDVDKVVCYSLLFERLPTKVTSNILRLNNVRMEIFALKVGAKNNNKSEKKERDIYLYRRSTRARWNVFATD